MITFLSEIIRSRKVIMPKSQFQSIDFDSSFIISEDLLKTPRLQMRVFTEIPIDGVTWHAGYSDPYLVINLRAQLQTFEIEVDGTNGGRYIVVPGDFSFVQPDFTMGCFYRGTQMCYACITFPSQRLNPRFADGKPKIMHSDPVILVAYSPLGRGFLTGAIQKPEDFAPDDFRRQVPRYQGENFQRNLQLVEKVKEIATQKNCTPAQLALAWLLAQGEDIIPIPGTKRRERVEENSQALDIELSSDDLRRIEKVAPLGAAAGTRYPEAIMHTLNR